jgi:hypothetical protein
VFSRKVPPEHESKRLKYLLIQLHNQGPYQSLGKESVPQVALATISTTRNHSNAFQFVMDINKTGDFKTSSSTFRILLNVFVTRGNIVRTYVLAVTVAGIDFAHIYTLLLVGWLGALF